MRSGSTTEFIRPSFSQTLANYADPETGTLGFDDDSGDGLQVTISNAQAAVAMAVFNDKARA
jgi:hypothetical protein